MGLMVLMVWGKGTKSSAVMFVLRLQLCTKDKIEVNISVDSQDMLRFKICFKGQIQKQWNSKH